MSRTGLDLWLLLTLAVVGVASRVFTNSLYAGEPTSDEYFYGLYSKEIARSLLGYSTWSVNELAADGHLLAVLVGGLVMVLPLDAISAGRIVQAACNALTIPLVFALGRSVGMSRAASLAASALFLVTPETWETAWRFWPDSQAMLVAVAGLLALIGVVRQPTASGLAWLLLLLVLAFLTKEYVAAASMPAVLVGGALVAANAWRRTQPRSRSLPVVLVLSASLLLLAALLVVLGARVPPELRSTAIGGAVERVLLAANRLLTDLPSLFGRVPEYLTALDQQFGPREFGAGFVSWWVVGGAALVVYCVAAVALSARRPRLRWVAWVSVLAVLAWAPGILLGIRLAIEQAQTAPGVTAVSALAALAVLMRACLFRSDRPEVSSGSKVYAEGSPQFAVGLVILGSFVSAFLLLRFLVWAAPDLRAAFTPRSFQPIFPVLALLAGWGMAESVRSVVELAMRGRGKVLELAGIACLLLLLAGTLTWLSPAPEFLSGSPLIQRRAEREGDLRTPGGLRITALVGAERWLQVNLLPGERILTSMPRHLAWYADLGVTGYKNMVVTGDLARDWSTRREKMMSLLTHPAEIDYVVDFNLDWTRPDSAEAQYWYAHYQWLRTRPFLEEAYSRRDPNGRVVFYAFRNHRWAASPSYVDREEARALALAASPG